MYVVCACITICKGICSTYFYTGRVGMGGVNSTLATVIGEVVLLLLWSGGWCGFSILQKKKGSLKKEAGRLFFFFFWALGGGGY